MRLVCAPPNEKLNDKRFQKQLITLKPDNKSLNRKIEITCFLYHIPKSKHLYYLHECKAEVVGGAAPVHRVFYNTEGKTCHLLFHQKAKVVAYTTENIGLEQGTQ